MRQMAKSGLLIFDILAAVRGVYLAMHLLIILSNTNNIKMLKNT